MLVHPRTLNRPHFGREVGGPLGAGANLVWTPPARQHIELLSIQIVFTTAIGGATREMCLFVGGAADDDFAIQAPIAQAANSTMTYWFTRGTGSYWTMATGAYYVGPLPEGLLFTNPEQLRTDILNIQGGDIIDNYRIRYQAWQDPVVI